MCDIRFFWTCGKTRWNKQLTVVAEICMRTRERLSEAYIQTQSLVETMAVQGSDSNKTRCLPCRTPTYSHSGIQTLSTNNSNQPGRSLRVSPASPLCYCTADAIASHGSISHVAAIEAPPTPTYEVPSHSNCKPKAVCTTLPEFIWNCNNLPQSRLPCVFYVINP